MEDSSSRKTVAAPEWSTAPDHYQLVGKIGQGAFATVYKANRTLAENRTNRVLVCAVKVLNLDHVDTNLEEIRLEVQAMRLLSHPNVLTCHTAFVNDRNLWVVTPLMTKGSSLHSLQAARRALRKAGNAIHMEQHILYIMHETLLGLRYIHENGQIHRDIKAGNILVDGNGDVRIADFGVSGFLVQAGNQNAKAKTFVGTPCWMAPEVMEQVHGYDVSADLWSLGITALELAKGYAPYAKYPPMKVLILTIQEDPPSLSSYDVETTDDYDDEEEVNDEYSASFQAFVSSVLQKDPLKRPSAQDMLTSKHFSAFSVADHRQAAKQSMRTDICSIVADVGSEQELAQGRHRSMPGNTPVQIVQAITEDRPAGTTWIFADGSQVLSSTAKPRELEDVFTEFDEFEKETGGEAYDRSKDKGAATAAVAAAPAATGIDNGKTIGKTNVGKSAVAHATTTVTPVAAKEADDDMDMLMKETAKKLAEDSQNENGDDLDQFMDEFELTTQGEDFRPKGGGP